MNQQLFDHRDLRMDLVSRTVTEDGLLLPLKGRQFDALWSLAQRRGLPVDKDTLLKEVWPDVHVGEDSLRTMIKSLREALGRGPGGSDAIGNIRNRGYFLALRVSVGAELDPAFSNVAEGGRPDTPEDEPTAFRPRVRPILFFAAAGAIVLVVLSLIYVVVIVPPPAEFPHSGRLLARSTSEGRSPQQIPLGHEAGYLAISPKGDKLFTIDGQTRTLVIVTTRDRTVRTLQLPRAAGALAVSRDGLLYIGSALEGVMVVDIDRERVRPEILRTGGLVRDMALTPDGTKLFLAMSDAGLKRLFTRTGKLDQISDRVCPEHVAMDQRGKSLYVAYQCSGPGGRPKHDSIEIFDVDKEVSLGVINGPPMVGGPTVISPDGRLLLQDGSDACFQPLEGCAVVPSVVVHLFRPAERLLLKTFTFPVETGVLRFLDNSRFILTGPSVSVVDAAKYTVLEKWGAPGDKLGRVAFAPDGHAAYFGDQFSNSILVMEPDLPGCGPPQQGLRLFYAGDGTGDDGVGLANLTAQGSLIFRPGRVGQAFYLDGSNSLFAPWTGYYALGIQDITIALYIKAKDLDGEMVLVDRVTENPQRGVRLLKSADNRLVFQSWPGGDVVVSEAALMPNVWYHLAVTRTDREVALYVNGKPEGHGSASPQYDEPATTALWLGANHAGIPSFRGWLDEIAFYDRALTAEEVKSMYQSREVGPCRL